MRVVKFWLFLVLLWPGSVQAAARNYVTWVFPVRGREYWRQGPDLKHLTVLAQMVAGSAIPATWLVHFDTLSDDQIVATLKQLGSNQEIGIFLEVTRQLALDSRVNYDWESEKWERADKVFLSGYDPASRVKLIDTAMAKFKQVWGYYPSSVGAWYIDSRSLVYLHDKYRVQAILGVADQYVTDGYQIWGQYVGEPYYPSIGSAIEPALNEEDKIDVVKLQWAAREPLLSYGGGGEYSNFSVQANDFGRSKDLGMDYFSTLVKTYTTNIDADLAQVTLGIEVGELENKYLPLVAQQIATAQGLGLTPLSMTEFAKVYKETYLEVSPPLTISSSFKERSITWYMSPSMRSAVLVEDNQERQVDLRYYHGSQFYENDWNEADKRQNLYRVVPAVVDKVGLGNSAPPDFASLSTALVAMSPGRLGLTDRFRLWVSQFIPDIRASKIEGRWVFGWVKDPQTLCLLTCSTYPYPYLEAFLKLDRWRQPRLVWYSRWQDQLDRSGASGSATIKNSPYGIEAMTAQLSPKKVWENSYYQIITP